MPNIEHARSGSQSAQPLCGAARVQRSGYGQCGDVGPRISCAPDAGEIVLGHSLSRTCFNATILGWESAMKFFNYILTIAISFGVAAAQAAPIVLNGDFEAIQIGSPFFSSNSANIPGWTHTGAAGDALLWNLGYGGITAGNGSQFVTIGGGCCGPGAAGSAAWTTTVTGLDAGQTYALDFLIAAEGVFLGASPQIMTVAFLSGSSTTSQVFTSLLATGVGFWPNWSAQSMIFVASASAVDIEFSVANQAFDMGLDCVTVRGSNGAGGCGLSVPEPSSFAILGVALAGLALCRRRTDQSSLKKTDG